MKRSQLTDGLQIILRNDGGDGDIELRKGHLLDYKNKTITSLLDYNEDLTHKKDKDLDIVKIIKGTDTIWNRMELDWTQIPVGTPVLVSNNGEDWVQKYFVRKSRTSYVTIDKFKKLAYWKYCRLTQESFAFTYHIAKREFKMYCDSFNDSCDNCKYSDIIDCEGQFIDDNFNITRK